MAERWILLDGQCLDWAGRDEDPPEGAVDTNSPLAFGKLVGDRWELDPRAEADAAAGSPHIIEARALKFAEALLVVAGIDVPGGMLAPEAEDKGIAVTELAAQVLAKRADFIAAELLRQQRQGGPS